MNRLATVVVTVLWSVIVWTALWTDPSLANVVWGAVVGAALLWVVPVSRRPTQRPVRVLGLLRWAVHLVWALVRSSAVVAWEVVTPADRVAQGIVAVELQHDDDLVTTLVANSVSLTPGTLTLEVSRHPTVLYVHVMHLHSVDEVREAVHGFEELVLGAFPVASAADDRPASSTQHPEAHQ